MRKRDIENSTEYRKAKPQNTERLRNKNANIKWEYQPQLRSLQHVEQITKTSKLWAQHEQQTNITTKQHNYTPLWTFCVQQSWATANATGRRRRGSCQSTFAPARTKQWLTELTKTCQKH